MVRFFNGKLYTEKDLQAKANLAQLGFNQREIDFLSERCGGIWRCFIPSPT